MLCCKKGVKQVDIQNGIHGSGKIYLKRNLMYAKDD